MEKKVNIIGTAGFVLIIVSQFVQFFGVQGFGIEQNFFTLWEGGERIIIILAVIGLILELVGKPSAAWAPLLLIIIKAYITVESLKQQISQGLARYTSSLIWGGGYYAIIVGCVLAAAAPFLIQKKS